MEEWKEEKQEGWSEGDQQQTRVKIKDDDT